MNVSIHTRLSSQNFTHNDITSRNIKTEVDNCAQSNCSSAFAERGRGVLRFGEIFEIVHGGSCCGGGGRVVPVLADELVWGAPAAAPAALPIRLGRGSSALEIGSEANIYEGSIQPSISKPRQTYYKWPVFLQNFEQI